MGVFVQDRLQRNRFVQRHDDEIFSTAPMEECAQVGRFPVSNRKEGLHGVEIRKSQDYNWRRSYCLCAGQGQISLPELLEATSQFGNLLGFPATIDVKMSRSRLEPPFFEERR